MNIFSKFFKKKLQVSRTIEDEQLKRKWKAFDFFQRGQEYYLNKQLNEALTYFDNAVEYEFEVNFPDDAA